MKVKHLHVTRYGPMAPFEHDDLGAFTLIHGPNEQGKTLLIDALVRLLFKKELKKTYRRQFGNMNRVMENPEGFVVIESKGVEYKLESKESLNDRIPVSIAPEDFRNVFLVRDSDLSLNGESGYYSRVTEKLTGLRSSEIERILRAVQKKGRLRSVSPDSDLSNNAEQGKIASRMASAAALIDEIRVFKESLQSEGYDDFETELVRVRERSARLEDEIEVFRGAEEIKRYKKARRTLGDLRRMQKSLDHLKSLDPGELKQWRELELRRSRAEADMGADNIELERTEKDIRSEKRQLSVIEANARKAADRLHKIDSEFRPKIDAYQYERAEYRRSEPQSGLYKRGLIAAGAVFLLVITGYMIRPFIPLVGIAGAALVAGVTIAVMLRNLRKAEGVVQALMDGLYTESKRYGLKVESVDELLSATGDLEDEKRSLEQEVMIEKANVENLVKEKARIENRIRHHTESMGEFDAEIAALKAGTRMESAEDYQMALDRRTKTEAAAAAKQDILRDMLPTDAQGEEALDEWRSRIVSHLRAADENPPLEYDAAAVAALKDELNSLQARKGEIEIALKDGSRLLHGIEVKAKELGILDESPPCRTTQELDNVARLIKEYCGRIDRDKRNAREAIRIFQTVDAEEKTRVGDLFGPRSSVSRHVAAITDGRYTSAHYDLEKNAVYLVDTAGDRVPARRLSGGAYDQLYLSIRLSLAESMLADEKGFLILDDPFVKADSDRLEKMMNILKHMVGEGWQVLYFSAKSEIEDVLRDDIDAGKVHALRLEGFNGYGGAAESASNELFD